MIWERLSNHHHVDRVILDSRREEQDILAFVIALSCLFAFCL